ncbi:single-stranded DNA-binding protein [Escherichia phage vB_EcoM_ESCO10]|nr:single-stranded DNA-binding protein [Escherichia phage vB_EcoM_ESCO10]
MINFYGYTFYALAESMNDIIRRMGVEYPALWLFVVNNTWVVL